ncbi:MAG: LysR family transcriptional regulator [Eggerthellaceae bacterium]|nr:LysR family transcriptional regulator [Eggerthellaceae bacterium]
MDISQMRMMLVLAECKSMTTTAKKLHVTQPALTYQLKAIESELGFKVFNRTRTGTSLTAEGAFLHETIKGIVAEYDETVRLARAMAKGGAAGTIRVGVNNCSRDSISFLLSMAQATAQFSLIPIGSSDPIRLLREGVIDFWSTSEASMVDAPQSLRFAELSMSGQSAFVPKDHRLARKVAIKLDDLEGETVWLWPRGTTSLASDQIRDQLEETGADIADLIFGVPALVAAFMDDDVVVYDDGFLPPSSQAAIKVPIIDAPRDTLGLVYLASQQERLAPIIDKLKSRTPHGRGRTVTQSEIAAERIVSVLDEISATVRRGGMKDIVPLVEYGLELGISAHHLLNRGLLTGMNDMGDLYRDGEVFMADMMASISTTNLAMDVLQPYIAIEDQHPVSGSAAIGTVIGDAHDIGKNLVRIMLESRDINVTDLGTEVAPEAFVEHVKNNPDCNLILISVNQSELLDEGRKVVEALKKAKLRDQLFIMVGGAAADESFAGIIGADAFTSSAEDAAETAYEFLSL